jgi:hypothetical protein
MLKASMRYLAGTLITLSLTVPAFSVELFRYRGAAKERSCIAAQLRELDSMRTFLSSTGVVAFAKFSTLIASPEAPQCSAALLTERPIPAADIWGPSSLG